MIEIRALAADEWPVWRDLRIRAVADAPDSFAITVDEEAATADEEWAEMVARGAASARAENLVAYDAGVPAGMGYVGVDDDGVAHVFAMWVAPESRRRGVATALLDRMEATARRARAHTIHLWVTVGEAPAEELYRRAGFIPTGEAEPLREGSDRLVAAQRREL